MSLVRIATVLSTIAITSQVVVAQLEVGGDARVNPEDFEISIFAEIVLWVQH